MDVGARSPGPDADDLPQLHEVQTRIQEAQIPRTDVRAAEFTLMFEGSADEDLEVNPRPFLTCLEIGAMGPTYTEGTTKRAPILDLEAPPC